MLKKDIDKLAKFITKQYDVYAPVLTGKDLKIQRIKDIAEIDYSSRIPDNTFKQLFLPHEEELFSLSQNKIKQSNFKKIKSKAAYGITVPDLKALGLFDLVFAKDPYYLVKRERNLVVGIFSDSPNDYEEYRDFFMDKEENVLEHIPFDIFIDKNKAGNFKIYSGSSKGRKTLRAAGVDVFENIQFVGLIREEGLDQRMLKLNTLVKNSENHPVWEKAAKQCTACNECSAICPTCFCFDLIDEVKSNKKTVKKRVWGSCFADDFSQVAGGQKFINTTKEKLFFWYEHKFCRIPNQYKVPGCVGCMRCVKACPAGINILQVLKDLEKND